MHFWRQALLALAGLAGAAGVALAAFAAHAGGQQLMTAALFLLLHAGPILAIGLVGPPRAGLLAGATLLAAGVVLFSGDLTLRFIVGIKPVPLAAPAGGMLLIIGWAWLAIVAPLRARRPGAE